jgi:hypothetical protein
MTKTCKDVKETYEEDLRALYEALEGSYGLALAQQIVDEIRKAERKDFMPDYVGTKSLSEALEFIRPKTLAAAKLVKQAKLETSDLPENVDSLYLKQATREFKRRVGAYRLAKATYHDFYSRIMTDLQKRPYNPRHYYVDVPRAPERARMGKAA